MEYGDFIVRTIEAAGKRLLELRDEGFSTSGKDGDRKNLVTSVDLAIDTSITEAIKEAYPDHAIYSEEGGGVEQASAYQWSIDPIDGTSNFSRGIPHYAVCLGILENGVPIAGGVHNPVTRETFSFTRGKGAFLNGAPISVSPVTELADSFVLLHAGRREDLRDWGGESYRRLLGSAKKTSNLGGSALDTCFVAAGRVEASIYGTFSTMDVAPALGILKEAGGVFALPDGSEPAFTSAPQKVFVANNKAVLDAVRELLA